MFKKRWNLKPVVAIALNSNKDKLTIQSKKERILTIWLKSVKFGQWNGKGAAST